ncbi:mannose-6-phosphate isomerase, class I [Microbacterium sp. gxy059]|uniref:mannose-6-phosphate isomerase, class I n=1 Tax=Microbacterium sp. gxy059 TaxID=2957199 RepID=UPI003D964343
MLVSLTNAPRDYAWGSRTLLASLEGREAALGPEAEVWFGDHPSDPADLRDGTGRTLDALLAERGSGRLPYLLKLLAAAKPLSIQVHPTKSQAEEGFAREASLAPGLVRNYADDNHKPEMIVALSDRFTAMCGLREIAATRRLLDALGPAAAPLAERISDEESLAGAVRWLLSGEAQELVDGVVEALDTARSTEFAAELSNARSIAAVFPGDPGIVVALLMNLVVLRRGEALFLGAGQLHSYQEGLGVEIMAASDNVLRGGLTPKHIDVDELMRILDPHAGPVPVVLPRVFEGEGGGFEEYPAAARDFQLLRARLDGTSEASFSPAGPAIVLAVDGAPTVTAGGVSVPLTAGGAAFVSEDEARVSVSGRGEVFVAQPGS